MRVYAESNDLPVMALPSESVSFWSKMGAGMQFGQDGRSTLGVRLQHLSNLGIKTPNPGINFVQVYYAYRF